MKHFMIEIIIIFTFLSLWMSIPMFSQNNDKTTAELQKINNSITEIRRDQLNYKIEKDLLKDVFSTNYQTINIVLTIILGIFSIIGFLGIRDISSIKKEYLSELGKLNSLRKEIESKIEKNLKVQEENKESFINIIKTNEEQNKRIKVLEFQEKISSFMKSNNYQRALEYISIGLELDSKNTILLGQKAACLWKLNDMAGSLTTHKVLLEIDPNNQEIIVNILELYLMLNQIEDFNTLYEHNKAYVNSRGGRIGLNYYFELLRFYQQSKFDELKSLFSDYVQKLSPEKEIRFGWDFSDLLKYLEAKPDDINKKILVTFTKLAKGEITPEDAKKEIPIP